MNPFRLPAGRGLLVTGAALLMVTGPLASVATAAGATVIKGTECILDAGDVPGLPAFVLDQQTLVLLPTPGAVVISCSGEMPAGISLEKTFQGNVTCFGDSAIVTGHIVATKSGHVSYQCRFATGG